MASHLKRFLVLALLCLAPFAHADLQRLQDIHEYRSEGYLAGTYLLIDNNLFERVREPGNREAYNTALDNMDQLLRKMGNPTELRSSYDEFLGLIRRLEGQPAEEAHYNLATVNQIMMAHAVADKAAAAAYEPLAEGAPEKLLTLHQQSLDINQILLLYQNSMFSSIGVFFVETNEGMFDQMNTRITERSAELRTLFPDMTETLNQLDQQYNFIKPRLLNHRSDWVPTIAAFYLLRNTDTLDNLSREQVRNAS
ncbi:MAG TPA: hypothetical protein ENI17_01955 [Pseudomonas xinjiangensis]|uniref:Uncharacterized protein n=2 Tax=root TaxID=1 RepID=A0A7V1BMB0_9GAMM|nr:hypothetical protein [Halopseudomonas xinjiangensis]HEC46379.1 hypothetical protein [Halopseudomonas xinjiangensis]